MNTSSSMMTPEDKRLFREGLNTPVESLMDGPVDSLLKGYKKRVNNPMKVKVIPTSREYRQNYDLIRWEATDAKR